CSPPAAPCTAIRRSIRTSWSTAGCSSVCPGFTIWIARRGSYADAEELFHRADSARQLLALAREAEAHVAFAVGPEVDAGDAADAPLGDQVFGPHGEGYVRFCFARERKELAGAIGSMKQ